MQNSCSNESPVYAGFWVRFAAFTIDHAIILFPLLIARLIISGLLSGFAGSILGGNVLFQYTLVDILLYVLSALYFVVCTYNTGTTLGKRLMNLQVISTNENGEFTLVDIIFRETIGRFLCGAMMSVGYIMVGLDNQKRGFHDMLSDTRVIYMNRGQKAPVMNGNEQILSQETEETSSSESEKMGNGTEEETCGFSYVPAQVESAPTFGETAPKITEGNYFYISGNELPNEEEASEEDSSEEENVD